MWVFYIGIYLAIGVTILLLIENATNQTHSRAARGTVVVGWPLVLAGIVRNLCRSREELEDMLKKLREGEDP